VSTPPKLWVVPSDGKTSRERGKPCITPKLWIVPADILRGNVSAERAAKLLSEHCGCDSWVLNHGSAVALSHQGALIDRGMAVDYPSYLEQTRPIFDLLNQMTIQRAEGLKLEIPDSRYWVEVLLQPNEGDRQWCSYIKNRLVSREPFGFRAVAPYRLSSEETREMKDFLSNSLDQLSREGAVGERLELGSTHFSDVYEPESANSYPKHGFDVSCSNYVPVTWPWIELYLEIREKFSKKRRFSIYFLNPNPGRGLP
jgi:hypothetical protein